VRGIFKICGNGGKNRAEPGRRSAQAARQQHAVLQGRNSRGSSLKGTTSTILIQSTPAA
jgi:hypothetical protein